MDRTIAADFEYEKSTKGTHRYQELVAGDDAPIVKQIYIQKSALPEHPPARITVEITFYDEREGGKS